MRADGYWQGNSFARVFNDKPYDQIHGYTNLNLSLIFTNQDGWQAMAYMKNVFNTTAITGAFLNSDDTGADDQCLRHRSASVRYSRHEELVIPWLNAQQAAEKSAACFYSQGEVAGSVYAWVSLALTGSFQSGRMKWQV